MKKAARTFSMLAVILCGSLSLPSQTLNDKLIAAIEAGKAETVRSLLAQGAEIDAKDDQGYTLLQHAVMSEQDEAVSILLKAGADPEIKSDATGNTALHWAVMGDNLDILRTLLSRGANLEAKNSAGLTPLLFAAANNKTSQAALLLSKGANLEAQDSNGNTPLLKAATRGALEIVKLLLDRGADAAAINTSKQSARDLATQNGRAEVSSFFGERDAAQTAQQKLNNKLAAAIAENNADKLKLLLDAGANIEANMSSDFNVDGYYSSTVKNITPLLLAVALDKQELVKLILARHANIDSIHDGLIDVSHYGINVNGAMTPLTLAIQMGKLPMAQLLAEQGANLEQRDSNGLTPLLYAIDNGQTEIAKYLLKKGADPGVKDSKGQSALQHAALAGNVEIGKLLQSGDLQYRQLEKTQWKDAQEQFTAYVSALSSDPQSVLLRRKVIELGAALPTAPAVPEAAKQLLMQASQELQQAKTPGALETPIALLYKTIHLAPWWGNAYYNLGFALQMDSKFDEAITMFAYYLDSKPSAADAAEAQTRIQASRTAKNAAK
jgi:ankyrin repeat protein